MQNSSALRGLGDLYYSQTKYSETEESLILAQQIYTRIGNDHGRVNTLRGLGELYRSQTKFSDAEESFIKAQQIYTRTGSEHGRANTLRGLGDLYRSQTKCSKAEEFFMEAQQIYTGLAMTKYSEAEESFIKAQQIYTYIGDSLGQADTLRGFGHLYKTHGRNIKSAVCYAQAKDLYDQMSRLDDKEEASRWLAIVSEESNSSLTS
ncbi:hypothetical protein M407DRAFT_21874 [Tulasnella calospora MUT 4182]|uniref:MalT-like TPR region domain-containing protein n=1 Tax=Tulasnella calospora MUT 4182 TaxID=1051891 RepID=A0A0C3L5C0_9AGAM|nr:hypothetical protein M407DRAFT_21874 [Tulasnella calospora MUT 4182]